MLFRVIFFIAPLVVFVSLLISGYGLGLSTTQISADTKIRITLAKVAGLEQQNRILRRHILIGKALEKRSFGRLSLPETRLIAETILRYSDLYGHDPTLLLAVIETESNYRSRIVSSAGAVGLMQVRPFVAKALSYEMWRKPISRKGLYDTETNVMVGAYYLAKLLRRFDGDLTLALEAYNRGPTRLVRSMKRGQPLTTRYTNKVLRTREKIRQVLGNQV